MPGIAALGAVLQALQQGTAFTSHAGLQALRDRLEVSRGRVDPIDLELRLRSVDQGLAVMHQHRGEACAAAGFEAQARQDLDLAVRKGFDPTRGVF